MFRFPRSALLVIAALSAGSVAPAQVGPAAEPLLATTSAAVPKAVTPDAPQDPAANAEPIDELAPLAEEVLADEGNLEELKSRDLASLVEEFRSSDPGSRELECLAVGIYFEAKSEPLIGQLAVGEVIANRAESGRFRPTYCGVLFQPGQFSFIRGKKLPKVPRSSRQWQTAVAVAQIVDNDLKDSAADEALFFHAKRVRPGWKLKRVAAIGNHVFYR